MKLRTNLWLALPLTAVGALGCNLPQDDGVVMSCFGLINQTVPGQGVPTDQVVTNLYFGGCNPLDPGMQIIERVTPAAAAGDPTPLINACNADCAQRLSTYFGVHPETTLPLSCQTLFVAPCEGLGADVSQLGSGSSAFQAGGPADTRIGLTGTVTLNVDGSSVPVPSSGIVDVTVGPCSGSPSTCTVRLSRFDVVASGPFVVSGVTVDTAQVQNQGLATGTRTPTQFLIPAGAIKAEVSYTTGGIPTSFHVSNDQPISRTVANPDPVQILSNLDLTMGGGMVRIQMAGAPVGQRPVADLQPRQVSFECSCKECTPVTFTSLATDVDNDLQSLTWRLNGQLMGADGTSAPPALALELGLGSYQVSLVATDTRGASAATSFNFSVADTTPPVVTAPPPLTLQSCSFPDVGPPATATTDRCSDVVIVASDHPGNLRTGANTITWVAQDPSGNEGRATQIVTVQQVPDANCCPAGSNVIVMPSSGGTRNGTSGRDCFIGSSNNDTINGLAGDDYIIGNGGQDRINGGDGNDTILGGDGDDIIDGGTGANRIFAGTGNDQITGGTGNDIVIGGDGDDTINTGDGDDRIFGNQGQDRVFAGNGNDYIEGGTGDGQTLNGEAGNDRIIGLVNNDVINGGAGDDFLAGLGGDDRLNGGTENDQMFGGKGNNTCSSGGGTDTFSFCTTVQAAAAAFTAATADMPAGASEFVLTSAAPETAVPSSRAGTDPRRRPGSRGEHRRRGDARTCDRDDGGAAAEEDPGNEQSDPAAAAASSE
jgi:hypothetical protein